MRAIFLLACLPILVCGQSIAVPHSGFTFDTYTKTFRPIMGVPGAARLGDAVAIRGELHEVAVCSQQQFAVAAAGREGSVSLLRLDTSKVTAISVGLLAWPTRIALSASCSAAAIYNAGAGRLQILTGLPDKPVLGADLQPQVSAISSLAISDDGQAVIAVVPGEAVYFVPSAGHAAALMRVDGEAVVAMRGNQDAIVADGSKNTVSLIENIAGSPSQTELAGVDAGIRTPSAVWFDGHSQSVIVAGSGDSKIRLVPVGGGSLVTIECGCTVGGFSPLGDRTYQLEAPGSGQPLRMLDMGASPPRVVFVATPEQPQFHKGRTRPGSEGSGN